MKKIKDLQNARWKNHQIEEVKSLGNIKGGRAQKVEATTKEYDLLGNIVTDPDVGPSPMNDSGL